MAGGVPGAILRHSHWLVSPPVMFNSNIYYENNPHDRSYYFQRDDRYPVACRGRGFLRKGGPWWDLGGGGEEGGEEKNCIFLFIKAGKRVREQSRWDSYHFIRDAAM